MMLSFFMSLRSPVQTISRWKKEGPAFAFGGGKLCGWIQGCQQAGETADAANHGRQHQFLFEGNLGFSTHCHMPTIGQRYSVELTLRLTAAEYLSQGPALPAWLA